MQSFSSFGTEIKKLIASQTHDLFQVGPGRAGPCRNETSFASFSRNQANVEQIRYGDPKKTYKKFC